VLTVTKTLHADGPSSIVIAPGAGDAARVRWWLIQTRGADGRWTMMLRPSSDTRMTSNELGAADPDEVAVTAISATGVAGVAATIAP
jgi:hypothetical protein